MTFYLEEFVLLCVLYHFAMLFCRETCVALTVDTHGGTQNSEAGILGVTDLVPVD